MKNLKKKKGFTLIELMIVLAIIGILAVVLVPKASSLKTNAKNAGVLTNVSVVRAYLESIVGNGEPETPANLQKYMSTQFTGDDAISNPFKTTETSIVDGTVASFDVTTTTSSVVIVSSDPSSLTGYEGKVVIKIGTGKYTVYGVDKGGKKVASTDIK